MSFGSPPAPKKPPPPANAPTRADASVVNAGIRDTTPRGFSSLVSSGPTGLSRRAETKKRTLIGGA